MPHTDAHISIDQIIISWLGKREYPKHYYIKALLLAAEAIQELSLTSLPMLHHSLITRGAGENWFRLPKGYSDYARIGVRYGDAWHPLSVSDTLMPYPNSNGHGDMNPAEFGDDMNTNGGNSSWYAGNTTAASFSGGSFSGGGFQTTPSTSTVTPSSPDWIVNGWYCGGDWSYGFNAAYGGLYRYRTGVSFDIANGLIVAPEGFPFNEIYLVWTGVGDIDNMTGIPVIAQAAIEAYIDFKYAANKRDISRSEAQDWERKFDNQHRLLRARVAKWSIEDVKQAFESRFAPSRYSGLYNGVNSGRTVETVFTTATNVYAGTKLSPGLLTGAQITQTGTRSDYHATSDISVTFPDLGIPAIQWVAWPATEIGIVGFYFDQFNFGPLGSGGLLSAPVYTDGFLYSEVNYPTQIPNVTLTHT